MFKIYIIVVIKCVTCINILFDDFIAYIPLFMKKLKNPFNMV